MTAVVPAMLIRILNVTFPPTVGVNEFSLPLSFSSTVSFYDPAPCLWCGVRRATYNITDNSDGADGVAVGWNDIYCRELVGFIHL